MKTEPFHMAEELNLAFDKHPATALSLAIDLIAEHNLDLCRVKRHIGLSPAEMENLLSLDDAKRKRFVTFILQLLLEKSTHTIEV